MEIKRPILVVAIGYIIGIIMGLYFNFSIAFVYIFLAAIYFIKKKLIKEKVKKLDLLSPKRYFRYFKLFLDSKALIIICITSIISNTITIFQNNKYETLYKDEENLSGLAIVVSQREEKEYNYTYKIKILDIGKENCKNTYLYLKVSKKNDTFLEYGDVINFKGEFQEASGKRNYGGFNYKDYLKSIKVYGTIKSDDIKVLEKNKGNFFISLTNRVSNSIKEKINSFMNSREAGMLIGILLGSDESIDEDIEEDFKISSLSHVLAVSGMQVTYIITGMYLVFKSSLGKRKTRIVIIIILIFYTALTGFSPSIVRASIMGILIMGAYLFYRKNDIWTSIFLSLLIMLVYNPFLITNVGLQLSYLGTIGIILFNKTVFKILKNIKFKDKKYEYKINRKVIILISKIKEILAVTISASMGVYPVMLFHFNLFGIYFLITNLLVSIILGPLTIFGTVVVIVSFISLEIAKFLSGALEFFINVLISISSFSNLPFSKIYVVTPKIFLIIIIYMFFIAFNYIYKIYHDRNPSITKVRVKNLIALYKYQYKKDEEKYKKKILIVSVLIIIIFSVFNSIPKDLKIYFVDVGQGDCTFIVTPKNKTILIDGGGSTGSDFDVGESTLLPYILDRGHKKIDLIFISHFDQDHVGGLITILKELKVGRVCISQQKENSQNYQEFLKIVKEKNIPVTIVKMGDRINVENNLYFDILWPEEEQITENMINNNAIVMKLNYNGFSCLFTGDIEKIAEDKIAEIYSDKKILKSDILKVAHHGSKTSTTEEIIEQIKPKIALIGVGKNNLFGHPADEVIERLEKLNIRVYRTDINGEITITVNDKGNYFVDSIY